MRFTQLVVVPTDDGRRWKLKEDLIYKGSRETFTIPAGFETDFASVPRIFWSVLPPHGVYSRAAVLHDWLYIEQPVSRKDADGLFRRSMKELGVGYLKRTVMWLAVRTFGAKAWNRNSKS